MKGNINEKRRADAKNPDLLDWLLAIDASLAGPPTNESNQEKGSSSSSKQLVRILEEGLYLKPIQ
jgi:hypothetical protein